MNCKHTSILFLNRHSQHQNYRTTRAHTYMLPSLLVTYTFNNVISIVKKLNYTLQNCPWLRQFSDKSTSLRSWLVPDSWNPRDNAIISFPRVRMRHRTFSLIRWLKALSRYDSNWVSIKTMPRHLSILGHDAQLSQFVSIMQYVIKRLIYNRAFFQNSSIVKSTNEREG